MCLTLDRRTKSETFAGYRAGEPLRSFVFVHVIGSKGEQVELLRSRPQKGKVALGDNVALGETTPAGLAHPRDVLAEDKPDSRLRRDLIRVECDGVHVPPSMFMADDPAGSRRCGRGGRP
jgi:hypothetical protein